MSKKKNQQQQFKNIRNILGWKGNSRETVLNAPLYIDNLKHSSKREEFAYPFWWGHEENVNPGVRYTKKVDPPVPQPEANHIKRPAAGIVRPRSPVYTIVTYPFPKKMVDEMTQTDFVRSRTNSVAKVEVERGRSPLKDYSTALNVKSPSPKRETESVRKPLKGNIKELLPQHEMLSPLVFEMPPRTTKSPEQFFIGFDQPPKKRPLKFAPRTSTPKAKIPIRNKESAGGESILKSSPVKEKSKIPLSSSPKKSPTKSKSRSKSPVKSQSRPKTPSKSFNLQTSPFQRSFTPTFDIIQTPGDSRLPVDQRSTKSSPFPEPEQPPVDGIYAMAIKFLNGPTIRCLEHNAGDLTFNTFTFGNSILQDSYWDNSNIFGST